MFLNGSRETVMTNALRLSSADTLAEMAALNRFAIIFENRTPVL